MPLIDDNCQPRCSRLAGHADEKLTAYVGCKNRCSHLLFTMRGKCNNNSVIPVMHIIFFNKVSIFKVQLQCKASWLIQWVWVITRWVTSVNSCVLFVKYIVCKQVEG